MKEMLQKGRNLLEKAAERLRVFAADESGMGTIEVILIIVVLIGLVMVFKREIGGLVAEVVSHIRSDAQTIYN